MLKKLFIVNPNQNSAWFEVIGWWEKRRILYNILLLFFLCFAFKLFLFFAVKPNTFFWTAPSFIPDLLFLQLWANVFYTLGWILELILRKISTRLAQLIIPPGFIIGILFSFCVQLVSVNEARAYIIPGEKDEALYPDYTREQPELNDIAGEYKLDPLSILKLGFADSLTNKTVIQLNADSSFILKNYPFHYKAQSLSEYKLINAKGTWKLEKYFEEYWIIPMTFEETQLVGSDYIERTKIHYFNSFRIIRQAAPYRIHVVYHPFLADGLILKKL